MKTISEYFNDLEYPGRNIVVGKTIEGDIFFTYSIMGRSEHSRNRIFVKEGGFIKTKAFDPSLLIDPSLIIYNAVIPYENGFIVTNGDQSDTVLDYLQRGDTFENALETRLYEDDSPNFTPRISSHIKMTENSFSLKLSIIKNVNNFPRRFYYSYRDIEKNTALIIQTYEGLNSPLLPFSLEPVEVSLENMISIETLGNKIFESQNKNNRLSLYAKNLNSEDELIINTNK